MFNLVKNALKFSKAKGYISIFAAYHYYDKEIRVKVEDNGIGVDRQEQDEIFNMFGKL